MKTYLGAISACCVVALGGCAGVARTGAEIKSGAYEPRSNTAQSSPAERARIHAELGALYLQEGRYSIALDEARVASASDPTYAPAYSVAGLVHMYLGEHAKAQASFDRALELAPDDPDIANNFGWFLCQSGNERRSFEYFGRAARNPLYQTPAKPRLNAGICHFRLGNLKDALSSLREALQYSPADLQVHFWLAQTLARLGDYSQARTHLGEIERRVELTAEALWLAVRVERGLGNRDAEGRYGSQLRKRFPGSLEAAKLLRGESE